MLSEKDPRTGEVYTCNCTRDQRVAFEKLFNNTCEHEVITALTRIKGGALQLREFCKLCGEGFGPAKKMTDEYIGTETFDIDQIKRDADYNRFLIRKTFILDISEQNNINAEIFKKEWNDYLQSDQWKKIRKKKIDQAHRICEGCGEREATEVHHLTYERRFTEMLFDLVALCPTCHSLVHFEKNEKLRPAKMIDGENYICRNCRNSCQEEIDLHCTKYGITSNIALNDPDYCDGGKNGFEELK